MQTLTIAQFVNEVRSSNKIFGVTFYKKSNGELRKMQARMHVSKGVKGVLAPGVRKAEDSAHNVLTVYDMQKPTEDGRGAFRRINLSELVGVRLNGSEYVWDEAANLLVKK